MQDDKMSDCSSCLKKADFLFAAKDYNKKISDVPFLIYRCAHCGYVFVKNVPSDLGRYYPREYYPIPQNEAELADRARMERYKIDLLLPHRQAGKLLEIGPAFGNFAYLAKNQGFAVQAIEMSPECCEFLRNVVKIPVIESMDLEAGLKQAETFDVIALWHVFEHLPQPWVILKALVQHLNPNGLLLLAMPNPTSIQFKILGRRWAHLDAPRHLCLIPPDTLRKRMSELGFTQVLETATDPGSIGWNSFGWQVSLINLFSHRGLRFFGKVVGKLISIALAPWERKKMRGSCYTVIYRKSGEAAF